MAIPEGYVDIEIRIHKDGTFERKIIREGKSVCKKGDEKSIIEDLLNMKVEGFEGDFGSVTKTEYTKDHWEAERVEIPKNVQTYDEPKIAKKIENKVEHKYNI